MSSGDDYKVISAFSTEFLEAQVNRYISRGYKPLGGVSMVKGVKLDYEKPFFYSQAILRSSKQ